MTELNKLLLRYITNTNFLKGLTMLVVLLGLFMFFKSSNVIFIYTDKKVKLELYDLCLDSLDNNPLDELTFIPKKPKYLVIHCTASIKDQTKESLLKVFEERWGKGAKPGYNYAVNMKGEVYELAPINDNQVLDYSEVVNGVKGYNQVSIHVAITGGFYKNNITLPQLMALDYFCERFRKQFPGIIVLGHRELASKDINNNGVLEPTEWVKPCPRMKVKGVF